LDGFSKEEKEMKCPECGSDNPDSNVYCGRCGIELNPSRGGVRPHDNGHESSVFGGLAAAILSSMGILAIIIGVFMGGVFTTMPSQMMGAFSFIADAAVIAGVVLLAIGIGILLKYSILRKYS